LNDVWELLDRIESGKSCQTLGATTAKALAPVAVLVWQYWSVLTMENFHKICKLKIVGRPAKPQELIFETLQNFIFI